MGRNDRRNRHNHKNWNNQNNQNQNSSSAQKSAQSQNFSNSFEQNRFSQNRSKFSAMTYEEIQKKEEAIRAFKSHQQICSKCGQPIPDLTSSISDKDGNPMHFDCVLETLKAQEKMLPGQQMTYIGNGRFAVVTFENPRDLKKFKIEKIIEYEDKSKPIAWRDEMANLYSQVK